MPAAYSPSSAKKMTACVTTACGMRIVQQEEDARRLGPRKFGLFTSWSDEVRISCNDGSLLSRSVEAGITIITLPIDCTAETNTVILRPRVDIEPQHDLQDTTLHFPPIVLKVANASATTLESIKRQQESLAVHFAPAPALGWLSENLDNIGTTVHTSTGAKFVLIIGCIVLCIIAGAIYCCCKKQKKNPAGSVPTANIINLGTAVPTAAVASAPAYERVPKPSVKNTALSYLDLPNRLLS